MSQMPRSQVDHQALYRVAFEQSLIGVAITTVQGEILEVNSAMCEVLGYSCEELTAMGFLGVTHPDDKATTDSILRALVAGEYSHHNFEKRYIAKSGRVIWAMVHIRHHPAPRIRAPAPRERGPVSRRQRGQPEPFLPHAGGPR